jgi:hypothetical protein
MRRARQLWQWLRSTATKLRQTIGLTSKFASWLKKAKSQQAHDLIMPLGILIGTVAFGLWSQSFTASLFAGIVLFFAAGIYKRNEQMLAALRKSEAVPQVESVNPHTFFGPTQEDSAAVNEAIRSLKPWLANEVSLTEENAKECCGLLVDSLAPKARAATGTTSR